MTKEELNWLSGLLEGEGSFLKGPPSAPNIPIITVTMTDEDIIAKVAKLLRVGYCEVGSLRKKQHWRKAYKAMKRGYGAIVLMKILLPLMGTRRKSQIIQAIKSYDPNKSGIKLTKKDVKEIRIMCAIGMNQSEVARKYKVDRTHICKIHRRKSWRFLTITK